MKREAFSMIELIFVIVILGILAAVALPKLAATRSDATASTLASMVATCINEAGGRYVRYTKFSGTGGANALPDTESCNTVGVAPCYLFALNDSTGILTLTGGRVADNECTEATRITTANGLTNGANVATAHQY